MSKKLLMGNEAIALGAIRAGVNVVTGYPGTPSTEVLETVARNNPGDIYVEWSVNEKSAMEVAAGAAYSGARTMVTMKQVGLNVASDPLMTLAYIGVKGGMVVLVADDPGPFSSQTEQDTRHFARYSNLPVLDPSSPEEAYEMIQYAFELSEMVELPVFLRPTTRICHSCATIDVDEKRLDHKIEGFVKDSRWVIFPSLAYKKHIHIEKLQHKLSDIFSGIRFNKVEGKDGKLGVVASGAAYSYVVEALEKLNTNNVKIFKVGTPYPFPKEMASGFLDGLEEVLVFEELDPVVEEEIAMLCASKQQNIRILGKKTGHLPFAGEYTFELVYEALAKYLKMEKENIEKTVSPELPVRQPVLCAGCPHRASFYAVKMAMKGQKAVFTGDIGCYTLGNAKPLDMVDTCLCMGAGVTVAQGIKRAQPDTKHIAFIGDSTFFHTGMPGIVNAVYNNTDITVVLLDNSTTAMTGHQPHPGTGKTMMNSISEKIDIFGVVKACGVGHIEKGNPLDFSNAVEVIKKAVEYKGPSVVIFEAPCIALFKPTVEYSIKANCKDCKKCITEIGCPAISVIEGKVRIEPSLCYGCGLCTNVCPFDAIGGEENE
ncbi:indolepyruvate ferredoxin oxidoreductase subunit alpha [Ruminiclostridium cellulolyticum]|uniref:Indolepyruvate oxidoreductase subunit IorA n=1 Tax=Ruminiclostridium cellulolyticum (strain ATCC 35319 / DSM 5812 / JCM 6584 / H10) TaxID=394503 RepID=B8I1E5_RUMCH|nr:indolepyruvate ferredoxin oxidoreductase subunit alpha [Ruminiclostridium cellulolyticum]ACL75743.1 indolepyruvate ferredoxin oxidoreductase, alpha subunit [Ruminiclostridium cellulolyticum H10]